MITVSKKYKKAMDMHIRNRSYMVVGIGVVNQEAQASATITQSTPSYISNSRLLFRDIQKKTYATLDNNFAKVDGTVYFPPRNNENAQFLDCGYVSQSPLQPITITFNNTYNIKGLTIDFTHGYPTKFKVQTALQTFEFENDKSFFETTTVIGNTNFIKIIPLEMVGNQQRLRINHILMGIGLVYTNNDIKESSYRSSVSPISDELSSVDFSVTILDPLSRYDIDDDNSFINFLETKQRISLSVGIECEDGTVEYVNKANLYLDSWQSKKGEMTFNAVDIFAYLEDEYTSGYKIYERTAYQEAVAILTEAGLQSTDYMIDECLKDVPLLNPMPKCTQKEALQLLANISRCILYQDSDGKLIFQANFANVLKKEDLLITSNSQSNWSKIHNILEEGLDEYVELTRNFVKTDGSQFFLPRNGNYKDTGYVSGTASDYQGNFATNPIITLKLPAAYHYYSLIVNFGGNPPEEIIFRTYYRNQLNKTYVFTDIQKENEFEEDFGLFERVELEITKTHPKNKVLISKFELGKLTDFSVKRDLMFENPTGYANRKTKDIFVKIFTYENKTRTLRQEDGTEVQETYPSEVDDDVYFQKVVNVVGENQNVENPLIHTEERARIVSEWLHNYFYNNTEYDVSYRGEPRINAGDMVLYESALIGFIQTEIMDETLNFNGALSGTLNLKKALKLTEV